MTLAQEFNFVYFPNFKLERGGGRAGRYLGFAALLLMIIVT